MCEITPLYNNCATCITSNIWTWILQTNFHVDICLFSAPGWPWSEFAAYLFVKLNMGCGRCLPLPAFFQEAASVPVSIEFEGVGWILHGVAQRRCRKLMDTIWVQLLRRQRKKKIMPLPSVKIHRVYCTFYSFSSAIVLLSSRVSKEHFIIPAVMTRVLLWTQVISWIFLFHLYSGNVFRFFCVHWTIQLGIIYCTLLNININCLE